MAKSIFADPPSPEAEISLINFHSFLLFNIYKDLVSITNALEPIEQVSDFTVPDCLFVGRVAISFSISQINSE